MKPQSWREAKNDMTTVYSFTIALACAPPSEFQGLAVGKIYRGLLLQCLVSAAAIDGIDWPSSGRETNKVLTIHNSTDTSTDDRRQLLEIRLYLVCMFRSPS